MEEKDNDEKERFTLYFSVKSSDDYTPMFEVSRDMSNMMCGLFNVHGTLQLQDTSTDVSINTKKLFLCTDLCESSSFVSGKTKLPILRQLVVDADGKVSMNIHNVLWLDTTNKILRNIRTYICDEEGNIPSFKLCSLDCTVLVFPKKNK